VNQGTITATVVISPDAEGYIAVYEDEVVSNFLISYNKIGQFNYSPFISLENYDVQALLASFILLEEELKHNQHRTPVYLHLFFSILSRIAYNSIEEPGWLSRDLEILFKFKALVQENHIEHKSVIFYANKLAISENYLNKCIKRTTGKSTIQWINETNILYSQILLKDPNRDVAQIAYELNFQSPSYFARLFKKITGQSPTEFRMKSIEKV
jgi:AraC-like DNA-binding protein